MKELQLLFCCTLLCFEMKINDLHALILSSEKLFCRAHWAGLVCPILSQSDLRHEGHGLSKIVILGLNRHHLADWAHVLRKRLDIISTVAIGPSFMFLARASSRQCEPMQQTNNNNRPAQTGSSAHPNKVKTYCTIFSTQSSVADESVSLCVPPPCLYS